ncbi:hypothetical protein GCM10023187_52550 [Nibrella viscosa]|uniref:Lipocalin-like domain-containing protein n=1 Tax=Nibrella viscosa TaxID=1084524 RepID=A0ABP8KXP3_9BACT
MVTGSWQITSITASPAVTTSLGDVTDVLSIYQQVVSPTCIAETQLTFSADKRATRLSPTSCSSADKVFSWKAGTWTVKRNELVLTIDNDQPGKYFGTLTYTDVSVDGNTMTWKNRIDAGDFDNKPHVFTIKLTRIR